MNGTAVGSRLLTEAIRSIVELASRAPSVHNTQPWVWRTTPTGLELRADHSRGLLAADPSGRNLMISCGAALHHAQVVAAALGWATDVSRFPAAMGTPVLAHISLAPGEAVDDAADVLLSVRERRTDRRRFTSWPVSEDELFRLARGAGAWGCHAVPVTDVTDRFRVDRLVERARDIQTRDAAVAREQASWIDRGPVDGIPATVIPSLEHASSVVTATRFGRGALDDPASELETSDGVILLCGYQDAPDDWLRTGEALSALWLQATLDGLSVVPLSQAIEVEETRTALAQDVLGGLAVPHLVVRLGWQALGRRELTRTSRRPLADVLDAGRDDG